MVNKLLGKSAGCSILHILKQIKWL